MDNNIDVIVSMQDNASAGIASLTGNLVASRSAIRELAAGTSYLGSAFLGMSVAMKSSNNAALQGVSNIFAMIGGIGSAIGASVGFISAIGKMTHALQAMNIAQIIANALSGPGGWAKLAIGAGVAGAAIYGTTKMMQSAAEPKASTTTVNNYVAGSIVTQRELIDTTQKGLLNKQDRSFSTGIR